MMQPCINLSRDDEDGISLLTTLLIRYPEICSVIYSPQGSKLQLRFILKACLGQKAQKQFRHDIINCINAYIYFAKSEEPRYFQVDFEEGSCIGVVEIVRDTATLTQREISLIINYIQERFSDQLVYEDLEIPERDILEQDNLISHMLEKLKIKYPQYNMMAVREEGRVFVFKR